MNFFELREKYGRSASSVGLGSKKSEKQDHEDAMYQADGDETKAAAELERMGYHSKDVVRIMKKGNPDIRSIRKTPRGYEIK
jgi:hypothetical protein